MTPAFPLSQLEVWFHTYRIVHSGVHLSACTALKSPLNLTKNLGFLKRFTLRLQHSVIALQRAVLFCCNAAQLYYWAFHCEFGAETC